MSTTSYTDILQDEVQMLQIIHAMCKEKNNKAFLCDFRQFFMYLQNIEGRVCMAI